jgi:acyl-CoA synthetase (AMP-forming)/AMP-acid ligase II
LKGPTLFTGHFKNSTSYQEKLEDGWLKTGDIGEIQEGRLRYRFLFLACEDNTVRVLSLEPESCLE